MPDKNSEYGEYQIGKTRVDTQIEEGLKYLVKMTSNPATHADGFIEVKEKVFAIFDRCPKDINLFEAIDEAAELLASPDYIGNKEAMRVGMDFLEWALNDACARIPDKEEFSSDRDFILSAVVTARGVYRAKMVASFNSLGRQPNGQV